MPRQDAWVRGTDLGPRGGITHGSQITNANTGYRGTPTASGVPAGVHTLNQSFLNTYNGGSATFSGKSFAGVEFNAYEAGLAVTFRDCLCDGMAVQYTGSTNGLLTFDYCTMFGTPDPYATPNDFEWSQFGFLNASKVTLTRCNIRGYGAGTIHCGDDVTIEECYLRDPAPYQSVANGGPAPDGTHHGLTTIQFGTCERVVIRRCKYKGVRGTPSGFNWTAVSASLTMYNDEHHPGPLTITDNYFEGGGVIATYWGAMSNKAGAYAKNITATGNVYGREYERNCGGDNPRCCGDFADPTNTWSNNTWGALGVAPGTDPAEGSAVSAPSPG